MFIIPLHKDSAMDTLTRYRPYGLMYFLLSTVICGSASGQYFEDPTKHFQKFEFDMMNRGSFNISGCIKDLLNCYELVKGDVICSLFKFYETVCVTIRSVCHDYYLDHDSYNFRFTTSESMCKTNYFQQFT